MGQRSSQIKEQYAEYVHIRTMVNWKFWVVRIFYYCFFSAKSLKTFSTQQFSIIMESLLDSYCNTVATSNYEEMCKTLLRWLDQSCCLITLRRGRCCGISHLTEFICCIASYTYAITSASVTFEQTHTHTHCLIQSVIDLFFFSLFLCFCRRVQLTALHQHFYQHSHQSGGAA